jgi:hypothetical protein
MLSSLRVCPVDLGGAFGMLVLQPAAYHGGFAFKLAWLEVPLGLGWHVPLRQSLSVLQPLVGFVRLCVSLFCVA